MITNLKGIMVKVIPRLASFPHSGPPYNSVVYLTYHSIFSHPCMLTFYTQGHLTYSRPTPTPSPSGHSPSFTLHNIAHPNLPPIRFNFHSPVSNSFSRTIFKSNRKNNQSPSPSPPALHLSDYKLRIYSFWESGS